MQASELKTVQHRTCIQRARYLVLRSVTASKRRRRFWRQCRALPTHHRPPSALPQVFKNKKTSGRRFLTIAPTSWGCPVKCHEKLWCLAHTDRPRRSAVIGLLPSSSGRERRPLRSRHKTLGTSPRQHWTTRRA